MTLQQLALAHQIGVLPYLAQRRDVKRTKRYATKKRVRKAADRSMKGRYLGRPSPAVSATLYTPGTRKVGNDGNIWVIRVDRNGRHSWKRL